MTNPTIRTAPHNLEAERALLGCLMIDPEGVSLVAGRLRPEMFFAEHHRWIYSAELALYESNTPVDFITLANELRKASRLEQVGAEPALIGLMNAMPSTLNLTHYAEIVENTYWKRKLLSTARSLNELAFDETVSTEEAVAAAESALFETVRDRKGGACSLRDLMREYIDDVEQRAENPSDFVGIPTGFIDIDRVTLGLNRSDFILIAGRPAMGKTALQVGMALHAAGKEKKKVGLFSLEMPSSQLVNRMVAAVSRIDSQRLRQGKLHEKEWPVFYETVGRLSEMGIFIDDGALLSPVRLRTQARRMYTRHGLDLIMVDFIQLMRPDGDYKGNEVQEISEFSRGMKLLARELDIPVVATSQLNRAVEGRQDKRPQLSDLRGSGSLEQDADIVMFIYRDEYYNPETTERPNIAEVNIAKHRNGPTGQVDLYWNGQLATFRNLQRKEFDEERAQARTGERPPPPPGKQQEQPDEIPGWMGRYG